MVCEQKYSELINRNAFMEKELRLEILRKKALLKEVAIQTQVISQLKKLLQTNQTKPTCIFKHEQCVIDHSKYNFVKPVNRTEPKVLSVTQKLKSSVSPVTLSRKINKLQSMYGVPPSFRQEVSEDLICSEFLTIWENVLFFQHNVLKSFPIKANSIQFPQKSYKKKYHHTSIILESRPLKFRIKK